MEAAGWFPECSMALHCLRNGSDQRAKRRIGLLLGRGIVPPHFFSFNSTTDVFNTTQNILMFVSAVGY